MDTHTHSLAHTNTNTHGVDSNEWLHDWTDSVAGIKSDQKG